MGKPNILNKLVEKYRLNSKDNHLVFMDANISLDKNCLENLIKMLCYNQVGMVGASVIPMNDEDNVESQYVHRENRIKVQESRSTGYAIGVFGACFAMKGEYFAAIPSHFITDDLYLTMRTIAQRKYVLYSDEAKVYEAMHADVGNEFKRKKRYAAGNFQILFHFVDKKFFCKLFLFSQVFILRKQHKNNRIIFFFNFKMKIRGFLFFSLKYLQHLND
jgi:cellulose synthase/poly-beta-1,6-N-acetylglucosamine synthase-like glycosyltransferase